MRKMKKMTLDYAMLLIEDYGESGEWKMEKKWQGYIRNMTSNHIIQHTTVVLSPSRTPSKFQFYFVGKFYKIVEQVTHYSVAKIQKVKKLN